MGRPRRRILAIPRDLLRELQIMQCAFVCVCVCVCVYVCVHLEDKRKRENLCALCPVSLSPSFCLSVRVYVCLCVLLSAPFNLSQSLPHSPVTFYCLNLSPLPDHPSINLLSRNLSYLPTPPPFTPSLRVPHI